jgi:hypothetical protein
METKAEEVKKAVEKTPAEIQKEYDDFMNRQKELTMGLLPAAAADIVKHVKALGVQPYSFQIGDDWFIYRVINRAEYQQLLITQTEPAKKLIAEDEIAGRIKVNLGNEEKLVLKCLLYPQLNEMTIKETPAGWVDTLHNVIMATSGFNADPTPVKL